jgi:indole-3-glycerol phosphate synthase
MTSESSMGILDRILAAKHRELDELGAEPLPEPPALRPLALRRKPGAPLRIIAEIKRRSPSAGALSTKLGVGERAAAYERAGAELVSVLCDRSFFDGDYEHLREARDHCSLPILCKEFVLDERQLDRARAYGADAVLLIVRCLREPRVAELVRACRQRGLEPMVEVTDERESDIAVASGATLIGVNARDLDTLAMDVARAGRVLASLPASVTAVHLSGLASPEAIREVASGRADAALIGEALMRQDDPEPLLRAFVQAARP